MTFGDDEYDVSEAGLEELFYRLRTADDLETLTGVIDAHGWSVPLALLGVVGVVRGVFEHLTDPFVIAEGYLFPGWPVPFVVNLVYGFFLTLFAWFMFFGLVGSLAGYLSDAREMDAVVFKVGSYFSLAFVPVFVVGWLLALTLTVPETVTLPAEATDEGIGGGAVTAYSYVHDTLQLHVVSVLRAATWVIVGFLMLPVVEHRYDLTRKGSVLAVLPVTLAAVVVTQLL